MEELCPVHICFQQTVIEENKEGFVFELEFEFEA